MPQPSGVPVPYPESRYPIRRPAGLGSLGPRKYGFRLPSGIVMRPLATLSGGGWPTPAAPGRRLGGQPVAVAALSAALPTCGSSAVAGARASRAAQWPVPHLKL